MIKWIVSWRFNDKEYSEGFISYELALMKSIQLESFGQKVTIHLAN
jgi:hypothetical protein